MMKPCNGWMGDRGLFPDGGLTAGWFAWVVFLAMLFSNVATAQPVIVQLVNGRNGKPVAKVKVYISIDESNGYPYSTFHTNRQGEVQFESNGARTFQVTFVGQVDCGERIARKANPNYSVAETLMTGLRTENNCGAYNPEPVPGRLIYIVRPATFWELFRN
jgi:hypothetical protein